MIIAPLSFPIQHDQPGQADKDPGDIYPGDPILENINRHRDKKERGYNIDQYSGNAEIPACSVGQQETKLDPDDGKRKQEAGPVELL